MKKWFELYRKLAKSLQGFYNVYKSNAGKELYKICFADSEFRAKNKWIEKFKPVFNVQSLDPVHIFSSFNNHSFSDDKKENQIKIIGRLLNTDLLFDKIDFEGCPSPFIIQMLGARSETAQEEVWKFFDQIVVKGQNGLDQELFKKLPSWYGLDVSSITIFLFWIDSENFLPLDKNTLGFLLASRKIETKPKNYLEYNSLLTRANTSLYKEIARLSYLIMAEGREIAAFSEELQKYLGQQKASDIREIDFKVVAIKLLKDIDPKYKKILHEDQIYQFYNSFDFSDGNSIKYDFKKDIKFYKANNLNINISAVVGRNGSGKSTLTELLYIALNNLAYHILRTKELIYVAGINMELYVRTESFYKIILNSDEPLRIYRYQFKDSEFFDPQLIKERFKLQQLFYTIAINYSHYALNSKHIPWVESLFHKNDAYQIPLVINPMRTNGNVDINTEDYLVKSRLLSNILEPILEESKEEKLDENKERNHRYITDDRKAQFISLSLDKEKFRYLYGKYRFSILKKDQEKILKKVYLVFDIEHTQHKLLPYINKYILKKLVKISLTYKHYEGYFNPLTKRFNSKRLDDYLGRLKNDDSHITYKLKQTINFLKYQHIDFSKNKFEFSIEELSDKIREVKAFHLRKNLKTIELIPPSFFAINIKLSDGSDFQDLSSGEKQRIYTVSSLAYHLSNLNSVSKKSKLITYNYVNVLFDEIELYYHPEMQRTFIHYLLNYLGKINLEIQGLNFCFITHSPLILSDIPNSNILFLKEDGSPMSQPQHVNTFGANIHELLADSFFLNNGFIGEFARQKIQDVIDNLQIVNIPVNLRQMQKEEIMLVINIIGEPFLKEKLWDMYYAKHPSDEIILTRQQRIEQLELELNELKNDQSTI